MWVSETTEASQAAGSSVSCHSYFEPLCRRWARPQQLLQSKLQAAAPHSMVGRGTELTLPGKGSGLIKISVCRAPALSPGRWPSEADMLFIKGTVVIGFYCINSNKSERRPCTTS